MQKSHAKNEQKLTKKHRKGLNATHRGIYFEEYPPSLERRFEKKDKDINMQNSQFWNFCLNSFFIFPNKIKNDFWRGEGDDFSWFYIPLSTQATHLKNVLNIFVMDPSVPGGERTPGELDIEVMEELEGEVRDSEGDSMELSDDNLYDSWWLLVYKITFILL